MLNCNYHPPPPSYCHYIDDCHHRHRKCSINPTELLLRMLVKTLRHYTYADKHVINIDDRRIRLISHN